MKLPPLIESAILALPGVLVNGQPVERVEVEDTPERISEKAFMWKVIGFAQDHGWRCYHTYDSRRSAVGFPDLLLLKKRLIVAELKTDKGKPTKDQAEWLVWFRKCNIQAYLWRPRDWRAIQQVLEDE